MRRSARRRRHGNPCRAPAALGQNAVMDPHDVLGLNAGASLDEAARAYRRLAKRWHPDLGGADGAARMIELNVAYELLRQRRAQPQGRQRAGRRGRGSTRRARFLAA